MWLTFLLPSLDFEPLQQRHSIVPVDARKHFHVIFWAFVETANVVVPLVAEATTSLPFSWARSLHLTC